MYLVTKPKSHFTYLVNALDDVFSVCKYHIPEGGWQVVEPTEANIARLTKMSREYFEEKVPKKYYLTLGAPVTLTGVPVMDENNRKTGKYKNQTLPRGTRMLIMWRKDGLTYCNYGGTLILVGKNSSHQYHMEATLNEDSNSAANKHADARRGVSEEHSEHTNI